MRTIQFNRFGGRITSEESWGTVFSTTNLHVTARIPKNIDLAERFLLRYFPHLGKAIVRHNPIIFDPKYTCSLSTQVHLGTTKGFVAEADDNYISFSVGRNSWGVSGKKKISNNFMLRLPFSTRNDKRMALKQIVTLMSSIHSETVQKSKK